MTDNRRGRQAALAGAFFLILAGPGAATPQVVGDEACAAHDVDLESFASCIDGKVVVPEAEDAITMETAAGHPYAAWLALAAQRPAGDGQAPEAMLMRTAASSGTGCDEIVAASYPIVARIYSR